MTSLLNLGAGGELPFYPETIDQSLRFEDGDSSYMTRTFVTPTNNTTWSYSSWIKLGNTGLTRVLLGGASTNYGSIGIESNDKLTFWTNSGTTAGASTALLRDTTNAYHIFVVSNGTNIKGYVNNQLLLTYTGTITNLNSAIQHQIGRFGGLSYYFDGYMAEVNFVDGTELAPTDFGEEKNSVWIPKSLSSLTYGNNGFRLTFEATGTGTTAESTDNSSNMTNIGDDKSGQGHNFAVNGLASTDVVPDSPTNNFAVLNPLAKSSSITLAEGNLKWSSGSHNYQGTTATIAVPTSGKWYFECLVQTAGGATSHDFGIGLVSNSDDSAMGSQVNNNTFNNGAMYVSRGDSGSRVMVDGSTLGGSNTLSVASGGIMQCAFDADSGKIWFGENNSWYDASYSTNTTANAPSAGANQTATIDANHEYVVQFNGYTNQYVVVGNFGQDSSFAGNKTSGSANGSDANGIGDFFYDPPNSFLALSSFNLSDTTLSPNQSEQADDYFNTITYTGDGASSRSLTGVGFQPDWIWYKHRSVGYGHVTYDSSRGTGENHLRIDDTLAEGGYNDLYGTLTSFDADGITVAKGDDGSAPDAFFNTNSATIVGWHWKASGSGTTSSNTQGTITSTVQANTDAGFSIVLYTGNGSSNADVTIGHGLTNLTPRMVIVKNRTDTDGRRWQVYHEDLSTDATYTKKNIILNLTNGESGYSSQIKAVSSTTFTVRDVDANDNKHVNKSGSNYVAYVFAEVEGYSKFGSYVGNGSTDGTYVHLGFRPAFLLIRSTTSGRHWVIKDSARDTFNVANKTLLANSNTTEDTSSSFDVDFLSNGFKCRTSLAHTNTSGETHIYMAFGDGNTAKFGNSR